MSYGSVMGQYPENSSPIISNDNQDIVASMTFDGVVNSLSPNERLVDIVDINIGPNFSTTLNNYNVMGQLFFNGLTTINNTAVWIDFNTCHKINNILLFTNNQNGLHTTGIGMNNSTLIGVPFVTQFCVDLEDTFSFYFNVQNQSSYAFTSCTFNMVVYIINK